MGDCGLKKEMQSFVTVLGLLSVSEGNVFQIDAKMLACVNNKMASEANVSALSERRVDDACRSDARSSVLLIMCCCCFARLSLWC